MSYLVLLYWKPGGLEGSTNGSEIINGPEVVAILEVVDDFLAYIRVWEEESKRGSIDGVADTAREIGENPLDALGGAQEWKRSQSSIDILKQIPVPGLALGLE